MDRVQLVLRSSIKANNPKEISSFTKLFVFLLAVWAESRFFKLMYENRGFIATQRESILSEKAHYDKWRKAVRLALSHYYHVPESHEALIMRLPDEIKARYIVINDILTSDLKPIIELRNSLAHGQWEFCFNRRITNLNNDKINNLSRENCMSLQLKRIMFSRLIQIIHDLVVSPPTFERDFKKHYNNINNGKNNLRNRSYADYVVKLSNSYEKSKAIKNAIRS